jgi:hypothetical protein
MRPDAHITAWVAADVDAVIVEAGPTPTAARRASAERQHPIDRAHHPDEDPADVAAKVEAWAAALPVVRVELHGDPIAVRAVLLHLAVEVPNVFMLPGVRAALDAGVPRPG